MDGERCKEMLEFVTENARTVSRSKNGWKGRTELKGEAERRAAEGKQVRQREIQGAGGGKEIKRDERTRRTGGAISDENLCSSIGLPERRRRKNH